MSPVRSQPSTIVVRRLLGVLVVALHHQVARRRRSRRSRPAAASRRPRRGSRRATIGRRPAARGQALVVGRLAVDEVLLRAQHRDRRRRLGLAVALHHHRAEHVDRLPQLVDRQRRGAGDEVAQRREVAVGEARLVEQPVDHRRRQEQLGHAVLLDHVEHRRGLRLGQDDDGAAARGARQRQHAGRVRHRRRREVHDRLVGPVAAGDHEVRAERLEAAVRVHHALGLAGRPAGGHHGDDVVRAAYVDDGRGRRRGRRSTRRATGTRRPAPRRRSSA